MLQQIFRNHFRFPEDNDGKTPYYTIMGFSVIGNTHSFLKCKRGFFFRYCLAGRREEECRTKLLTVTGHYSMNGEELNGGREYRSRSTALLR